MKKVLAIAPYPYLPYFSGGQKFIAQFLEWLGKKTELTVIGTRGNDGSLSIGYAFIPLLKDSFSRYFDYSLVRKISKIARDGGYDTIIWEHPYYGWLAKRVKQRTGIHTILHTHNIEHQRFRSLGRWWWPILKNVEKKAFQQADHLLFITPEDKAFAINEWKIPAGNCIDVPFGIGISAYPVDKATQREFIAAKHEIDPGETILLFNGLLDYKPNTHALLEILDRINPVLLDKKDFRYKIIICGKGLPAEMDDLKAYSAKNIIYAGFVDDIIPYFKAADLFLNPVVTGGGVKTKMVEAIAYGATVIAYATGAGGIYSKACGQKLVIVPDNDCKEFGNAVIHHANDRSVTPAAYYETYYWENVIRHLLDQLADHPATAAKDE